MDSNDSKQIRFEAERSLNKLKEELEKREKTYNIYNQNLIEMYLGNFNDKNIKYKEFKGISDYSTQNFISNNKQFYNNNLNNMPNIDNYSEKNLKNVHQNQGAYVNLNSDTEFIYPNENIYKTENKFNKNLNDLNEVSNNNFNKKSIELKLDSESEFVNINKSNNSNIYNNLEGFNKAVVLPKNNNVIEDDKPIKSIKIEKKSSMITKEENYSLNNQLEEISNLNEKTKQRSHALEKNLSLNNNNNNSKKNELINSKKNLLVEVDKKKNNDKDLEIDEIPEINLVDTNTIKDDDKKETNIKESENNKISDNNKINSNNEDNNSTGTKKIMFTGSGKHVLN